MGFFEPSPFSWSAMSHRNQMSSMWLDDALYSRRVLASVCVATAALCGRAVESSEGLSSLQGCGVREREAVPSAASPLPVVTTTITVSCPLPPLLLQLLFPPFLRQNPCTAPWMTAVLFLEVPQTPF